ncbi:MAG: hypothetical protein EZS28_029306 [Streblomastix strix]|uniref:Uncharacterized protein n=1 Tax=Streblomastix strix TaxID=222440 RepID=A0A5J4UWS8_9EUKA|nr:MAG: hypothetical protein EZS28_029306 [Streblomastix strix]
MEGKANTEKTLSATIKNEGVIVDMIRNIRLTNFPTQVLRTQSSNYHASNISDGGGFIKTIMSLANIKSLFVTIDMSQYPTWFFPVLFKNIDLIIDQRHVFISAYPALIQDVCGQMDLKLLKTYYPNKFMLAWKLATDDSFMRGYNSSKIGARTNIQVQLGITPVNAICNNDDIRPTLIDQNDFKYFTSTRCYPNIKNVKLSPLTHYLCDGIVRIMFDDNPDPQMLSLEIIGEMRGSAIRSG